VNAPENGALIKGEAIMFRIRSIVSLCVGLAFVAPTLAFAADGKAVFLDKKCNKCHSVSSASIEKTSKLKGPDLTTEALKGDAKTLKAYLKKQDAIGGKKHGTAFTGTDEELDSVVTWVLQQNKGKK
jgi:mono/diheme cytochrome c family protein